WHLSLFLTVFAMLANAGGYASPLDCDREMRKTFEAIQAWRRMHNGAFPDRLADLKTSDLLPLDSAICPDVLREGKGASATFSGVSSSADAADPSGTYQYEMSARVPKWVGDRL